MKCAKGRPKRPVESILSNNYCIDLFNIKLHKHVTICATDRPD